MPSLGLIHPSLLSRLAAFYPLLCTIQTSTETQDAVGEPIPSWGALIGHIALHCRVGPAGGGEQKRADGTLTRATHTIALAGYYPTLTTKMRAIVGGATYDILGVQHDNGSYGATPTMTVLETEIVT